MVELDYITVFLVDKGSNTKKCENTILIYFVYIAVTLHSNSQVPINYVRYVFWSVAVKQGP